MDASLNTNIFRGCECNYFLPVTDPEGERKEGRLKKGEEMRRGEASWGKIGGWRGRTGQESGPRDEGSDVMKGEERGQGWRG